MSTYSLFLETLRRADLDNFYPNFATRGINNLEALAQLTMQDYSSLGVTSMDDRKRLFQLIQMIKTTYPTLSAAESNAEGEHKSDPNTVNGIVANAGRPPSVANGMANMHANPNVNSSLSNFGYAAQAPRYSVGSLSNQGTLREKESNFIANQSHEIANPGFHGTSAYLPTPTGPAMTRENQYQLFSRNGPKPTNEVSHSMTGIAATITQGMQYVNPNRRAGMQDYAQGNSSTNSSTNSLPRLLSRDNLQQATQQNSPSQPPPHPSQAGNQGYQQTMGYQAANYAAGDSGVGRTETKMESMYLNSTALAAAPNAAMNSTNAHSLDDLSLMEDTPGRVGSPLRRNNTMSNFSGPNGPRRGNPTQDTGRNQSTTHANTSIFRASTPSTPTGRPTDLAERIRVCVRKRPVSKKEEKRSEIDVASVVNQNTLIINEPKYGLLLCIPLRFPFLVRNSSEWTIKLIGPVVQL
jgi:hypothetical protein